MTDFVNPFYKATQEVFRLMLDLEIQPSSEQLQTSEVANKEVCISIGITGDLEGTIYFCFPESMTLEMVRILSGMEMDALDDFVSSAMSEIVNIISGNAVTGLSENHYTCDILPPVVKVSDQPLQSTASGKVIPLKTVIGPMEVEVDLQKKGA
ncbi:chemotaxis protein CheX [Gorillibacterium timonense]|uniref:chemotaxis protein CheX n=1 Tax=Gorillibacterium timonense TaxID=1689269 RepID=UPI00071C9954|nr:chemotaxis protein CheX [Gorillibacterium timonense]